jgi:hypothetical protein
VNLVDIWNIIESFRENGLNAIDNTTEVGVSVTKKIFIQLSATGEDQSHRAATQHRLSQFE